MIPESVHRSPHTFEIVEPLKGKQGGGITGRRPVGDQASSFANSELADHPVTEAEQRDPDRLWSHDDRVYDHDQPNHAILHEKPSHRFIVYLKAQGLSNKEVAERTGHTQAWISQLTRQPWFRLRLVQELKEVGVDAVSSALKSAALDSVYTLIDLRDDVTAPKAVRRSCADSLLDRWLGKPTLHVSHEDERIPSSPEISQVDSELQRIEQQLKETDNGKAEV